MPNEIRTLDSELGLRDVPGKLVQRWRYSQRFWCPIFGRSLLNAFRDEVIRIRLSPRLLLLPAAGRLAFCVSTGPLTGSDPWIGTEPSAANTTRSLSSFRHGDSSSPHHFYIKEGIWSDLRCSFLPSRRGSLLESAEENRFRFFHRCAGPVKPSQDKQRRGSGNQHITSEAEPTPLALGCRRGIENENPLFKREGVTAPGFRRAEGETVLRRHESERLPRPKSTR